MKKYLAICLTISCISFSGCGNKATSYDVAMITRVQSNRIIIDGKAGDWEGINPVIAEVGSLGRPRGLFSPKIDIGEVKMVWDQKYLYTLLRANHAVGAKRLT